MIAAIPLYAGDPGSSGGVFLKLGVDGRAIAMGEAQTGLVDNVNSLFWNPAGLDKVKGLELAFMHNFHFMDMHHDYLGIASPVGNRGTIGLAVYYWTSGTIQGMDEKALPTSEFSAWDLAAGIYYANQFSPTLSVGLGLKAVMESNEEEGATAFAGDAGVQFSPPLAGLTLGMTVKNLGTKLKLVEDSYPLPVTIRLGAGWTPPLAGASLVSDVVIPTDDTPSLSVGGEYSIMRVFALRAGYKTGSDLGATAGLRAGCGFTLSRIGLDYAFAPYGELGSSHRVSLLVKM
jgi:hypothetical protein